MVYQAQVRVTSDLGKLNDLQAWFRLICNRYGGSWTKLEEQVYRLNLALVEGFTNAVRHAHAGRPCETAIDVEVALDHRQVEIRIWDTGAPFNPETVEEPKPGTLRIGGYGWFLLRRLMDQVTYNRSGDRNCLLMVKSLV
jgi:serine/threonine-protein kinase RsbW